MDGGNILKTKSAENQSGGDQISVYKGQERFATSEMVFMKAELGA